jgi:hypothetical protein
MGKLTEHLKQEIAYSFPTEYAEFDLRLTLPISDWEVFDKGISSTSMEEKWNVFAFAGELYWARSWTNHCIFKIFVDKQVNAVKFGKTYVNRNTNQFNSADVEQDRILLLKLIQMYLKREDLYVDPKLELPLIRETIDQYDPRNEYKKSVGSNGVGLTKKIYDSLIGNVGADHVLEGWVELRNNLAEFDDQEPLINVHLLHRETKSGITFYFNGTATKLLGFTAIRKI